MRRYPLKDHDKQIKWKKKGEVLRWRKKVEKEKGRAAGANTCWIFP